MKKEPDKNQQRNEEAFIDGLLKNNAMIEKAPEGFTNRVMLSIAPVRELSPDIKKPLLNIKAKMTALAVLILLFLVGLSLGHELTGYVGLSEFNLRVRDIFKMDYTIILTTVLFALTILLHFNELLKRYFEKR